MKIDWKSIGWYIVIIIIIIFAFRECSHYRQTTSLLATVVSYKDSAKTYRNVNGDLTAYNQTLEFDNKKQMDSYLQEKELTKKELDKWKSISPAVIIKTVSEVKHDTVRFKDTIPAVFKPIHFSNIDKNFSLFGTITPRLFVIDSLRIPNEQNVIVGEKKMGFLKSPEKRVEVTNSNPLIRTTNLGVYAINEKKKWYQTTMFKVGVGVVAGFTIRKFTIP